jgi:nucleotidyltransferase substrate binding protein (TIGR01987 family)
MENHDIRWKQRFENFENALRQLKNAKEIKNERDFSELELQGSVQAFEVTQELSWKVMKDFLEYQGKTDLFGSKTVVKEAFNVGLIKDGEIWFEMIRCRNTTSHIYDEFEILQILDIIFNKFINEFIEFELKMKTFL